MVASVTAAGSAIVNLLLAGGVGDVVVWDNAALLHSATLTDPGRLLELVPADRPDSASTYVVRCGPFAVEIGAVPFAHHQRYIDEVIAVDDSALRRAMRFLRRGGGPCRRATLPPAGGSDASSP